jgi:hypothetical protein
MIAPATKTASIIISIGVIATMISISIVDAFADPQHCDKLGSPSCYSIGYSNGQAHPGTISPSGHSSNFQDGWKAGAGTSGINNNLVIHNSPLIW